jgi:hypothetical protein
MNWKTTNPPKSGNYLVETKTTSQGRIQRLESTYTVSEKDPNKGSWGFTNQVFQRWLDETKTTTLIVCIPTEYGDSRKVCDFIGNETYKSLVEVRDYVDKELGVDYDDEETEKPLYFNLTDFIDECNDQVLNIETYFISYVQIIQK